MSTYRHSKVKVRWFTVALFIILGMLINPWIEGPLHLDEARNWLSQRLLELDWRLLQPRFTRVVLIRDDEYWSEPLAGRVPIKRDYLANLVENLSEAGAHVIALDFDLRLPVPAVPTDFPEYHTESARLAQALVAAAEHHKIVLPVTLGLSINGEYYLEPDLLQLFGLCTRPGADGSWVHDGTPELTINAREAANISCGYIVSYVDARQLPGQVKVQQRTRVDSFSLAVLRAQNPSLAKTVASDTRYASYLPQVMLENADFVYSAHAIMAGRRDGASAPIPGLEGQSVIVGGNWHTRAYGRGPLVDLHSTPVGMMAGALVHANFAEALYDSRTYRFVPRIVLLSLEVIVALIVAKALAVYPTRSAHVAIFIVAIVAMVALEWAFLHAFGVFLEVFLPVFAVFFHSILERLWGERHSPEAFR